MGTKTKDRVEKDEQTVRLTGEKIGKEVGELQGYEGRRKEGRNGSEHRRAERIKGGRTGIRGSGRGRWNVGGTAGARERGGGADETEGKTEEGKQTLRRAGKTILNERRRCRCRCMGTIE